MKTEPRTSPAAEQPRGAAFRPSPPLERPALSREHDENLEIAFRASDQAGPAAISSMVHGASTSLCGVGWHTLASSFPSVPQPFGGGGRWPWRVCRSWRWQPYFAAAEAEEELPKPLPDAGFQRSLAPPTLGEIVSKPHPRGSPGERRGRGLDSRTGKL